MLLPGCDLDRARQVAERRGGIEALRDQTNGSTVSIGIALYRAGDNPDTLFKRADGSTAPRSWSRPTGSRPTL